MTKVNADLGHVQESVDNTEDPSEIHVSNDYFKSMQKQPDFKRTGTVAKTDEHPVTEGPIGSTKQLGTYGSLPVYSHGREPEHVYVHSDENESGDWYIHGDVVDEPNLAGVESKPIEF